MEFRMSLHLKKEGAGLTPSSKKCFFKNIYLYSYLFVTKCFDIVYLSVSIVNTLRDTSLQSFNPKD